MKRKAVCVFVVFVSLVSLVWTKDLPDPIPGPEHPILVDTREWEVGTYGGSVRIQIGDEGPSTFNPVVSSWWGSERVVNRMLFSAAIERDPLNGRWVPKLAEKFELRDGGRIFYITLRENLHWSDGTPLTVDDIIYSYRAIYLQPDNPAITDEHVEAVGGVSVFRSGARSYIVEMGRIHPDAWLVVGWLPLPKHVVEPLIKENGLDSMYELWDSLSFDGSEHVGSGPFRLAEQQPDEFVRMERNPHYYEHDEAGNRLPYLDEFVLVFSETSGRELFLEGSIDVTPIGDYQDEERSDNIRINDSHYIAKTTFVDDSTVVWFNQSRPYEENEYGIAEPVSDWLRNEQFLLALAYLVDRGELNREVLGGEGSEIWTVARTLSPEWFDASPLLPQHDPTKANRILDELGWIDSNKDGIREDGEGNPIRFRIFWNEGNWVREMISQLLADQFSEGGIEVTVDAVPWLTLIQEILFGSGDWDAIVLGTFWVPKHDLTYQKDDWEGYITHINDERPFHLMEELDRIAARMRVTLDQDANLLLSRTAILLRALHHETIWLIRTPDYYAMRVPYHNFFPRPSHHVYYGRQLTSFERVFIPEEYR